MGSEFSMCTGATDKGCSYCGHRGCYCRCPGGKRELEHDPENRDPEIDDPEYGKNREEIQAIAKTGQG